jgi:hypothetical protein
VGNGTGSTRGRRIGDGASTTSSVRSARALARYKRIMALTGFYWRLCHLGALRLVHISCVPPALRCAACALF